MATLPPQNSTQREKVPSSQLCDSSPQSSVRSSRKAMSPPNFTIIYAAMFNQSGVLYIVTSTCQNGFSTPRLPLTATAHLIFFTHPLAEQTVSLLDKTLHQRSTCIAEVPEILPQIGCDPAAQQNHHVSETYSWVCFEFWRTKSSSLSGLMTFSSLIQNPSSFCKTSYPARYPYSSS